MRINTLRIKNYRGYEDLEVEFKSNFNLIIGDNGSGKTALLESLTIAMATYFLGITNLYAKGIARKDIRIKTFEFSEEYQFPVEISAVGVLNNIDLEWKRELNGLNNKTTTIEARSIVEQAKLLNDSVANGNQLRLPLLAYYSTGRLFDEARDTSKDKEGDTLKISSRFRAYDRCLEAKSNHKQFIKWFKAKEIARIQKRTDDLIFDTVRKAVIDNLPDCRNFYFEFDPDKPQGLKLEFNDGRILPFNALSDGTRNFFAILSDLAYKAATLNPHLREQALQETEGIVLIDELDLHLHPEWQRKIVDALRTTFPKIQFICSTHSPFIIQATEQDELLIIRNNKVSDHNSAVNLGIEDIAEIHQHVENPQWSQKRKDLFELAPLYYQAIKNDTLTEDLKKRFEEAAQPFSMDTAFFSALDEEKIIREYLKNKDEGH